MTDNRKYTHDFYFEDMDNGPAYLQALEEYFAEKFPARFHGTYTAPQDVATIMTWVAAVMTRTNSQLTLHRLEAALDACALSENLATDVADKERIIRELTDVFHLLKEEDGLYSFIDFNLYDYFAALAITGRKGITPREYLSSPQPDFTTLLMCTRKSFSTGRVADGRLFVDYGYHDLKRYLEKYPQLIPYMDLREEMPPFPRMRSAFGDLIYFLINSVRDYSPQLSQETVGGIYSLIFRLKGAKEMFGDMPDLNQCKEV